MTKRVLFDITPGLIDAADTATARLTSRTTVETVEDTEDLGQFDDDPSTGWADFQDETPAGDYRFVVAINGNYGLAKGMVTLGTDAGVYLLDDANTSTIVVTPLTGTVLSDVDGTNINTATGESKSVSIAVVDASGVEIEVEGLTLSIVIEDRLKNDVATIADGAIGKADSTITFTIPSQATTQARQLNWALWNEDVVLLNGIINVRYVPTVDV